MNVPILVSSVAMIEYPDQKHLRVEKIWFAIPGYSPS